MMHLWGAWLRSQSWRERQEGEEAESKCPVCLRGSWGGGCCPAGDGVSFALPLPTPAVRSS